MRNGTLVGWIVVPSVALVVLVAGCSIFGEDREDVPAFLMSRAEVVRILNANMRAVDPDWTDADPGDLSSGGLTRDGCWTNPNTLMPEGPPWSYRIDNYVTPEIGEGAVGRLDEVVRRGFVRQAEVSPSDPRNAGVIDPRKFSVNVFFSKLSTSISSSSPCVRHPDPADDKGWR